MSGAPSVPGPLPTAEVAAAYRRASVFEQARTGGPAEDRPRD